MAGHRPTLSLLVVVERNIRHLTDVMAGDGDEVGGVVIQVQVDAIEPPVGSVSVADDPSRPFSGWLGLLRVLSEVLEETSGA